MKANLASYVTAHTAPAKAIHAQWTRIWNRTFTVEGTPTTQDLVGHIMNTKHAAAMLDGQWRDVLVLGQLFASDEMALRLMILGHRLNLFEVREPSRGMLAFRAKQTFRDLQQYNPWGKKAYA